MNTPGMNSNAVAELVFGMLVTHIRNHYDGTSGYELREKTLGLSCCLSIFWIVPLHYKKKERKKERKKGKRVD